MKKTLLTVLFILAIAFTANAFTADWDAADGADGYRFYWRVLGESVYTVVDVGNVLGYDLEPLALIPGVRYEFYVTTLSNGSESDQSDIVRWTMPSPPVIVEIPEAPKQLIINF